MIITKTPFRMSFFGGGTDMEDYFRENGGAVLSTTFDKYCYVNVRHLPRFFDYTTELSYSRTERVTDINEINHPAIREAMKMLDMHEIRLTYEADLPARSGLGTSSSFAVGMLNAFYGFSDTPPSIGNGVRISAGAKVIGNIMLGDNSIIGANAAVVKNVDENAIVGGCRQRILAPIQSINYL